MTHKLRPKKHHIRILIIIIVIIIGVVLAIFLTKKKPVPPVITCENIKCAGTQRCIIDSKTKKPKCWDQDTACQKDTCQGTCTINLGENKIICCPTDKICHPELGVNAPCCLKDGVVCTPKVN